MQQPTALGKPLPELAREGANPVLFSSARETQGRKQAATDTPTKTKDVVSRLRRRPIEKIILEKTTKNSAG
jgi:hypothetical protein